MIKAPIKYLQYFWSSIFFRDYGLMCQPCLYLPCFLWKSMPLITFDVLYCFCYTVAGRKNCFCRCNFRSFAGCLWKIWQLLKDSTVKSITVKNLKLFKSYSSQPERKCQFLNKLKSFAQVISFSGVSVTFTMKFDWLGFLARLYLGLTIFVKLALW